MTGRPPGSMIRTVLWDKAGARGIKRIARETRGRSVVATLSRCIDAARVRAGRLRHPDAYSSGGARKPGGGGDIAQQGAVSRRSTALSHLPGIPCRRRLPDSSARCAPAAGCRRGSQHCCAARISVPRHNIARVAGSRSAPHLNPALSPLRQPPTAGAARPETISRERDISARQ